MKRIILLLFGILIAAIAICQVPGNFKQIRLLNNVDSVGLGSTTGIIRYDPITGKYRYYNALTSLWFTPINSLNLTATGNNVTLTKSSVDRYTINIPDAGFGGRGVVSTGTQYFTGEKRLTDGLVVEIINSSDNTIVREASLYRETGATPSVGLGTGFIYIIEAQANNFETAGALDVVMTDNTATSEDFDFSVKLMDGGAAIAERFRITSDGAIGLSGASYGTTGQVLTSNGTGVAATWENTIGGTIAATQVGYGSGANTLTSEAAFTYDAANNRLTVDEITNASSFQFRIGGTGQLLMTPGVNTFSFGKTRFTSDATNAAANIIPATGTPSSQANGDLWYDDTGTDRLMARINGADVDLGALSAPAGSNTQVQFNNVGTFGADADLTWNSTTNDLLVTGSVTANQLTGTNIDISNAAAPATSVLYTLGFTNGIHGEAAFTYAASTNTLTVQGPIISNGAGAGSATYEDVGITITSGGTYTISNTGLPVRFDVSLIEVDGGSFSSTLSGTSVNFSAVGNVTADAGTLNLVALGSGNDVDIEPDDDFNVFGPAGGITVDNNARLYGTFLHNNPAGTTGTTNQYIASGTYTPTSTNIANVSSSTPGVAQYIRVGNVVTVSGAINATVTTTGLITRIELTLPIGSALVNDHEVAGIVQSGAGPPVTDIKGGHVEAEVTSNNAELIFGAGDTGAAEYFYTYTYVVL